MSVGTSQLADHRQVAELIRLSVEDLGLPIRTESVGSISLNRGESGAYTPTLKNGFGPLVQIKMANIPGGIWIDKKGVETFVAANAAKILLPEMIVLAHEIGHFLSHKRGNRSPEYEGALAASHAIGLDRISAPQKALVMIEEVRAWRFARVLLKRIGFKEWSAFAAEQENGLLGYRNRMVIVS